jgi:threonine synthase
VNYLSTRGEVKGIPFREAVMMGLADDGGLLLPESIPRLSAADLEECAGLSYPELALRVMSPFIGDIHAADLESLIRRSCAGFSHPDVTPVIQRGGLHILELFHGPTLAFKDVALQFLGNLFEYLLAESGARMNILGATSGDTGSAAIYGVRGKRNINIFILHPQGKVSAVQERQMTTVTDANVFNLAIRGTFDDGQRIVKEIFGDLDFKKRHALGAINSINWARVLAQVVYYFYAWGKVKEEAGREVSFSVPTGNFGDIFAGCVARRMGLPIGKLILATNANNILTRFINDGDYSIGDVRPTLSPSMDIQLASNFERYLYLLYGGDAGRVRAAFAQLATRGAIVFSTEEQAQVRGEFLSRSVDDEGTVEIIGDFYRETGYVLDPHTAVGVKAARELSSGESAVVCLATAHPAKFPDAVRRATGRDPERPPSLEGLEERERRCETIDADRSKVKAYLEKHALPAAG